jgi:hypothetical protein
MGPPLELETDRSRQDSYACIWIGSCFTLLYPRKLNERIDAGDSRQSRHYLHWPEMEWQTNAEGG